MNVISLFSGCGGLDYGMEAAGWNIAYRNDFDEHSCATLRLNGKNSVQCAPIEEVSFTDISNFVGSAKNIDLVIGGPPCQPFSKSAFWSCGDTLRLKDPRSNTLSEYFRIIEEFKPKAFILENVQGINYSGKEDGFQFIIKKISEINRKKGTDYRPRWDVLNAANFGVPQLRFRFFLVALRSGKEFKFPQKTHHEARQNISSNLFDNKLTPYLTAWDALAKVEPDLNEILTVSGKWGKLLPSIPEGENYLWHTDRKQGLPLFGWRRRYWSFLLKLAKNKPSWTIQAQPGPAIGPFHWKNRKLSWRELAALQTFPPDFKIEGPRAGIQRQIGNAVPSLLGEVLGRALIEQVFGLKSKDTPSLALMRQYDVPPPETVTEVPEEYLSLVGTHAFHPGTGKGRSYFKNSDRRALK
jgi:DNA (cytosine-5)-methyltransferase 1